MNWTISIGYSWWYSVLCLFLGAVYAFVLYFNSNKTGRFDAHKWVLLSLPLLRFVLASILAFLLLGPVLKYAGFETQKPIVAILVDDSKSLVQNGNTTQQIGAAVSALQSQLSQKYESNSIAYSNLAQFISIDKLTHTGYESNMSQALRYVQKQYVNQNLGAVVLISDGIYNAGSDPQFVTDNFKVPVYTVGVGDTTVYADLGVSNVTHNSLAYFGSEFPFRIEVKASELQDKQATLQVLQNGAVLQQKNIWIDKNSFYLEIDVVAKASKIGQNKMEVRLNTAESEKNKTNNSYTFYVDVIDGKKKVAIWSSAPHPDLGMLRAAIQSNENYEATIFLGQYEASIEYDLVVLHNWFASQAQLKLYEKLRSGGVPTLFIAGADFNARIFNEGTQAIKYTARGSGSNAVLPLVNGSFEYFELEPEVVSSINKWPPLRASFGKYSGYLPSDVLLYQQIGAVPTQEPLALLSNAARVRFGLLAGTGIWQWRLVEYEQNESHQNVNNLVNKMVQYLAVKDDKKLLKVYPTAKQYGAGESVILLGELYNQSLDAIPGQEINIDLKDETGKSYKHTMSASGDQYKLLLKNLDVGAYQYSATASVGGVPLKENGYFTVLEQQKEMRNLTADFNGLRAMANTTGGAFVPFGDMADIGVAIQQNSTLQSVIAEENKFVDLIKMKWLFWILFGLLAMEWFIRKWTGSY